MSPQRQAIVHAIRSGHCTPKSIGHFVGKPHKTISKLLYLMEKDGVIGKVGYGKYQVENSSIELQKPLNLGIAQTIDNNIGSYITVSRIESIEQRLSSVETWQKQHDEPIKVPIDNLGTIDTHKDLESKIKGLQSENEELKIRLDDKDDDDVASINALEKERYDQQAQINDLKDTILSLKRTHAKDRENFKGEQDKLVQSLKSKNSKLQAQVEQLQAQIEDSKKEAQPLKEQNADLEFKLEAIQTEAQANIDQLTQKLGEAKQENERLASEYNQLHEKYTALKVDVDDGEAPTKSTKRKPLTLDSDAQKASVNDVTIEIDDQEIVIPDGQVPENREVFLSAIQQIASLLGRVDTVKLLNDNGVKTFRGKKFTTDILRKPPFNC